MTKHRDVMGSAFEADELEEVEAVDPMSGLSNLADCMLVLACGLMVALVVHWNLNMTPHYEVVEETGELVDVEGEPELVVEDDSQQPNPQGENVYENMGTLYRDNKTGKLYYLQEQEEEASR